MTDAVTDTLARDVSKLYERIAGLEERVERLEHPLVTVRGCVSVRLDGTGNGPRFCGLDRGALIHNHPIPFGHTFVPPAAETSERKCICGSLLAESGYVHQRDCPQYDGTGYTTPAPSPAPYWICPGCARFNTALEGNCPACNSFPAPAVPDGCTYTPVVSRVCERGTGGCSVVHAPAVPQEGGEKCDPLDVHRDDCPDVEACETEQTARDDRDFPLDPPIPPPRDGGERCETCGWLQHDTLHGGGDSDKWAWHFYRNEKVHPHAFVPPATTGEKCPHTQHWIDGCLPDGTTCIKYPTPPERNAGRRTWICHYCMTVFYGKPHHPHGARGPIDCEGTAIEVIDAAYHDARVREELEAALEGVEKVVGKFAATDRARHVEDFLSELVRALSATEGE